MTKTFKIALPTDGIPYAEIRAVEKGTPLPSSHTLPVLELLREHGAVLLRDFGLELDSFEAFTNFYTDRTVIHPSMNRDRLSANVQTVELSGVPFALHCERSRTPDTVEVCWFACKSKPTQGGETTFCDGIRIANDLRPELFSECRSRNLRYRRCFPLTPPWSSVTEDELRAAVAALSGGYTYSVGPEGILQDYVAPMLSAPKFQPDQLAWTNYLLFTRFSDRLPADETRAQNPTYEEEDYPRYEDGSHVPESLTNEVQEIAARHTYAHPWEQGDVMMIDNTRFLHGRLGIDPKHKASRVIWSRFGCLR